MKLKTKKCNFLCLFLNFQKNFYLLIIMQIIMDDKKFKEISFLRSPNENNDNTNFKTFVIWQFTSKRIFI